MKVSLKFQMIKFEVDLVKLNLEPKRSSLIDNLRDYILCNNICRRHLTTGADWLVATIGFLILSNEAS